MFNINEFRSNIERKGVLQNNRFIVEFALPRYLQLYYGQEDARLVSLRCEIAQIPGLQITTVDFPRIGFGPLEFQAHNFTQDDINLTFLVDAHGSIPKLFYDWLSTIVNFTSSQGHSGLNRVVGLDGKENAYASGAYEVGFKDDYSTDLKITVYDKNGIRTDYGDPVMELTAFKAFPKAMSSIDMAWQNQDELMRLQIPFAYTDFNIEYFKEGDTFDAGIAAVPTGPSFERFNSAPPERNTPTPDINIPTLSDQENEATIEATSGFTVSGIELGALDINAEADELARLRQRERESGPRTPTAIINDPNASSAARAGARTVRRDLLNLGPKI